MPSNPSAFVSYSWDSPGHRHWVKQFATRLRADGVDVTLDRWSLVPGDRLPYFMEQAVRENEFVIVVGTPDYRTRSDNRVGGVGYEGDIMTGEILNAVDPRKFLPVLRAGSFKSAFPSWLKGKYVIDLRGDEYSEQEYLDLLTTLHAQREKPPPIGTVPELRQPDHSVPLFSAIRVVGLLVDETVQSASRGDSDSERFDLEFRLSEYAPARWRNLFIRAWDSPVSLSSKSQPGIANVDGNRLTLEGVTLETSIRHHRSALAVAVEEANCVYQDELRLAEEVRAQQEARDRELREKVESVADHFTKE